MDTLTRETDQLLEALSVQRSQCPLRGTTKETEILRKFWLLGLAAASSASLTISINQTANPHNPVSLDEVHRLIVAPMVKGLSVATAQKRVMDLIQTSWAV